MITIYILVMVIISPTTHHTVRRVRRCRGASAQNDLVCSHRARTCNSTLEIVDEEGIEKEELRYRLLESTKMGEIVGYTYV